MGLSIEQMDQAEILAIPLMDKKSNLSP